METIMNTPVTFTEDAIKEIKKLMNEPDFDQVKSLRVGVKGGGCSGMSYLLNFDQPDENDARFEIDGIPCIMNKAHEIYIYGMVVDWEGGLNSRGFTFKNPNATATCGCGTSFGA